VHPIECGAAGGLDGGGAKANCGPNGVEILGCLSDPNCLTCENQDVYNFTQYCEQLGTGFLYNSVSYACLDSLPDNLIPNPEIDTEYDQSSGGCSGDLISKEYTSIVNYCVADADGSANYTTYSCYPNGTVTNLECVSTTCSGPCIETPYPDCDIGFDSNIARSCVPAVASTTSSSAAASSAAASTAGSTNGGGTTGSTNGSASFCAPVLFVGALILALML